jgi:membrane protease YdiL (CAAX protease family)
MDRGQTVTVAVMAPQLLLGACLLLGCRRMKLKNCHSEPLWHGSGRDCAAMALISFSLLFILPDFVAPFFTDEWAAILSEFVGCCSLATFGCVALRGRYFSLDSGCSPHSMAMGKAIFRGIISHLSASVPIFLIAVIWPWTLALLQSAGLPLSLDHQDIILAMENASPAAIAISAVGAAVAGPIGEEILFRGTIHRYFKTRFGCRRAAIFGSLAFAILHGNLCALIPLFVLSLLITRTYEREGNIIPCIVMHSLFNCNGIALAVFAWC